MSLIDTKIDEIIAKLGKFEEEFAKEFVNRVKIKTPVLSGKLQDGWDYTINTGSIDISNSEDYAKYVEFGTVKQPPKAMVQTTMLEVDQIAEIAKEKAHI